MILLKMGYLHNVSPPYRSYMNQLIPLNPAKMNKEIIKKQIFKQQRKEYVIGKQIE